MAHRRGNSAVIVVMLLFCMLAFHSEKANAKTFVVGETIYGGWDTDVSNWPSGKTFKAGDELIFYYNPDIFNVVRVNAASYNACTAAPSDKVLTTGGDKITLNKGESKMAQGRGNSAVIAIILLLCMLVFHFEIAHATKFIVGDKIDGGWDFGVSNWPSGKIFKAGDILEFNYNTAAHNVAIVDAAGYNSCTASRGSKVFISGQDRITLKKGQNYFICSVPGHCPRMKIAVFAQ